MSNPNPQFYGGDPWYALLAFFLAFTLFLIPPFAGVRLYNWVKDRMGYNWLANHTEDNTMVLTWWSHTDSVEKLSCRNSVLKEEPIANFFIAENEVESVEITRNCNADYVLVAYPSDVYKFGIIASVAGKNPVDYITPHITYEKVERRSVVKKATVGMKMMYGEEIEGFEKVFDNKRIRIYKLTSVPLWHRDNNKSMLPNISPT